MTTTMAPEKLLQQLPSTKETIAVAAAVGLRKARFWLGQCLRNDRTAGQEDDATPLARAPESEAHVRHRPDVCPRGVQCGGAVGPVRQCWRTAGNSCRRPAARPRCQSDAPRSAVQPTALRPRAPPPPAAVVVVLIAVVCFTVLGIREALHSSGANCCTSPSPIARCTASIFVRGR